MNTFEIETEEAIEKAIVDSITGIDIPVVGVLASFSDGEVKQIDGDNYVYVKVDQQSQDGDYIGNHVPHTYQAQIGVRYSMDDDANGKAFVDTCRAVRYYIQAFVGDGCQNLNAEGFECDEFMINSTQTSFEGGQNPTNEKVYSCTIIGRKQI